VESSQVTLVGVPIPWSATPLAILTVYPVPQSHQQNMQHNEQKIN